MIVYHGSYTEIITIDLSKTMPNKDFGKGFYVTNNREQAEFWAKRQGVRHRCEGVVTEFKFADSAFVDNNYKTLRFPSYSEEWFDFVIANRDRTVTSSIHDYDIIEGPIADDDIYNRIEQYLKGEIAKKDFLADLATRPDSHQICLCTTKSLCAIERTNLSAQSKIEKISISITEQLLRDGLPDADARDLYYESQTYAHLSDESVGLYNKSWQEIYETLKKEIGQN